MLRLYFGSVCVRLKLRPHAAAGKRGNLMKNELKLFCAALALLALAAVPVFMTADSDESAATDSLTDVENALNNGDYTLSTDLTIANTEKLTIPEGKTLTVAAGVTLTVEGQLAINGELTVNGTLAVGSVGQIHSTSTNKVILFNNGAMLDTTKISNNPFYDSVACKIMAGATVKMNYTSGPITLIGTITDTNAFMQLSSGYVQYSTDQSWKFTATLSGEVLMSNSYAQNGTDNIEIEQNASLTIGSSATFVVAGTMINNGTINNEGTLTVTKAMTNSGTLNNSGTISSTGTGTLTNNGAVINSGSGTVSGITGSFDVTVTSAGNGTVSPAVAIVGSGASLTITLTPAEGYAVSDVLVNGVSQHVSKVTEYVLTNVTDAAVVVVEFSSVAADHSTATTYTVTIPYVYGSGVNYTDSTTVASGGSFFFHAWANDGYQLDSVTASHGQITRVNGGYQLSGITSDTVITIAVSQVAEQNDETESEEISPAIAAAALCVICVAGMLLAVVVISKKR